MRKWLMASAAVLGAGVALSGYAAAADLPYSPFAGKMVVQPSTGGGANNNNNYQGPMLKGPVANPTPGSMVVHFYGRVLTAMSSGWSSLDSVGGNKIQPQGLMSYMRLYPGVDGMATNGLRYGASIEIRENFSNAPALGATSSSSSGIFASTGSSAYTSQETMYVRRAFVYMGTDQTGILRVGQADGIISIFDNGVTTLQFLPTGNLNNGDLEYNATPSNVAIPFAFAAQAGNEYGSTKIVYLSPQFAGFDVGLEYAPSGFNSEAPCGVAGLSCAGLSSTNIPGNNARSRNQYQAGVRYQGKFGDMGVLAYAAYMGSGKVNYTGTTPTTLYDNLSLGSFGVAVTYGGFTVAGNVITGQVNGQLALKPKGGADETGVIVGATYKTGPLTVGLEGESIDSQGAVTLVHVSQRHEYAIDAGASYSIAPGLTGWVEYVYQHRHQGGFDFATGANGAAYNNVQAQSAMIGAVMTW